jgi:hypothetical protein
MRPACPARKSTSSAFINSVWFRPTSVQYRDFLGLDDFAEVEIDLTAAGICRCLEEHKYDFDMQVSVIAMARPDRSMSPIRHASMVCRAGVTDRHDEARTSTRPHLRFYSSANRNNG